MAPAIGADGAPGALPPVGADRAVDRRPAALWGVAHARRAQRHSHPGQAARRLSARHRPLRHRRRDHRRRQVRLDGAHRPHLSAHQAGTDADPVVCVCLRGLRALAGGAVRPRPRVMAVALWPHPQVAGEELPAHRLAFLASAHCSAVAGTEAEAAGPRAKVFAPTCRISMRVSPRRAGASRANCRRPTRILKRR